MPYLSGYQTTLDYAVRKTYWPNIDLIPACLALYEAELAIVMHLAAQQDVEKRVQFFMELKYGLQTVADRYDVILLDSPPALGMISINVLMAADALLVPSAARMFDFSSTVQFFRMVHNYIGKIDATKQYRWISVLTTLFDQRYESQKQFYEVMGTCFADSMFKRVFFHSAEVINSAAQFVGPYEQPKPNRKVLEMMDSVFGEIEVALLKEWPSKRALPEREGDCVMATSRGRQQVVWRSEPQGRRDARCASGARGRRSSARRRSRRWPRRRLALEGPGDAVDGAGERFWRWIRSAAGRGNSTTGRTPGTRASAART